MNNRQMPEDKVLLELLTQAYKGEILCTSAFIKPEGIVPFSDYQPEIPEDYKELIFNQLRASKPIPLYVYPKDGKFVMSDDYQRYYVYLELQLNLMPCIVIGEASGKFVKSKSEPFRLPPPVDVSVA